jgi:hypothetical protein
MLPEVAEMPLSAGAIAAAAGLIFFAYYGFENLANISEETKNVSKVIPKDKDPWQRIKKCKQEGSMPGNGYSLSGSSKWTDSS